MGRVRELAGKGSSRSIARQLVIALRVALRSAAPSRPVGRAATIRADQRLSGGRDRGYRAEDRPTGPAAKRLAAANRQVTPARPKAVAAAAAMIGSPYAKRSATGGRCARSASRTAAHVVGPAGHVPRTAHRGLTHECIAGRASGGPCRGLEKMDEPVQSDGQSDGHHPDVRCVSLRSPALGVPARKGT